MTVWAGLPYPLGATFDGFGTNFSVFSEVAEKVELCLFDAAGTQTRIRMPESTGYIWHCYLPQIGPGQAYGYRVHGPWAPEAGARCIPEKLLLDPYAKAVEGDVRWNEAVFPYHFDAPEGGPNRLDSAPFVPRSVVIDPTFDWGDDRPIRRADNDTVIYEVHVKGFTERHPGIPKALRGTYAGLAHPAAIEHLTKLGVTAVELQPVHQFVHDAHLVERGLRNYWGYNSIGFLAPHGAYAAAGRGDQVREFKEMVKALHSFGIEVILDVVYNHTAEGNHLGPMLSMKGLDNAAYYRLVEADRRFYMDYTGTGNTLNVRHPHTLQLIMDSLRYWILDMHVDGFRFDLASALARELHAVDRLSAFFDLIHQDPTVSQVKLIAEPWDVGEGGYQVGNFPPAWSEWNGRYRDSMRDVWRGQPPSLGEFASRLSGSSDLYETTGRRPYASINFITAHDGFTLADLVAYNEKHNEANGEENRDGESHNRSWNHGIEGPTDDPEILAARRRHQRNLLATLFLSQGVPMLLGGDELGRTQGGNNNAYCQDNELSWFDWHAVDTELLVFVQALIAFRHEHPAFHRRRWFLNRSVRPGRTQDIEWFRPDGSEMAEGDWSDALIGGLGVFLSGEGLVDPHGEPLRDDTFFLAFNMQFEPLEFCIPSAAHGRRWRTVLDTSAENAFPAAGTVVQAETLLTVPAQAIVVLRREAAAVPAGA